MPRLRHGKQRSDVRRQLPTLKLTPPPRLGVTRRRVKEEVRATRAGGLGQKVEINGRWIFALTQMDRIFIIEATRKERNHNMKKQF